MIKRFIILSTGFLSLCAGSQKEIDLQHQKWRESLGSEDFKTRSATMDEIWGQGRKGLGFIQSLIEGENPELAARAKTILRKVNLGVTPETPEEIVLLIDRYFNASAKVKLSVIEKLTAAEEYDVLLRLRRLEGNAVVLKQMDKTIDEFLPKIVRAYLNENDLEAAKECLLISGRYHHLIHYAHLLDQTGELDAKINVLSQSESEEDAALYLACLRVKGDPVLLRDAAKKLSDQDAQIFAELNLGNHLPYLESLSKTRNLSPTNQYFIDWSLAGHKGELGLQREIEQKLVVLSKQAPQRANARMNLFRIGRGDLVVEGLKENEMIRKVEYLLTHENYAAANELLGIPEGDQFDEWLESVSALAAKELQEKLGSLEQERLLLAARFLEDRGELESALKCSEVLFELVRGDARQDFSIVVSQMVFAAPICAYTQIAKEIEKDDDDLKEYLMLLPVEPRNSEWLYARLENIYPEQSVKDRLLLLSSFSARRLLVPVETFEEARDTLIEEAKARDDEGVDLNRLLVTLLSRNRETDLKLVLEALEELGKENAFLRMEMEIDAGRHQAGAELFKRSEPSLDSVSAQFLYKRGVVLKRAGFEEGDELMAKAALFSNGSANSLRNFAMTHLRLGEIDQAYEILRKALLRTNGSSQTRKSLMNELAKEAAALGKWQEALAYREVVALDLTPFSLNQGLYKLRSRFHVLLARGAFAMEQEDINRAVKCFLEAHKMLPRDGYLANDFFPLLRDLGLIELHDQLFAQTARHCRESIRLFPKDDNAYNNFAWLASRANRCLDEAEAFLKIALTINPQSSAYLDTMAEIYFARGNREEAVAWSTKSLENEVLGNEYGRWELQHQNQRFKTGAFPKK